MTFLPDPITFTDGDGSGRVLIVGADIPRSQLDALRYATPDDLARAGYESPLTVRGHIDLLRSLGYFVENPKAADSEIRALLALEAYVRDLHANERPHHQTAALLKAIDEARK